MLPSGPLRGRGAAENPKNRFERFFVAPDELEQQDDGASSVPTEYFVDESRSIIAHNDSPDVGFEASINPYRGCEHGCVYCYARPTHEYLGLSAGLDFETRIFVKVHAPELLREELSKRSWKPQALAISGVTDAYQPVERKLKLTRRCLEVLAEFRNPVGIVTKNALVTRDIDLLGELARFDAASVAISVTTLDEELRRVMEPRTSTIESRLAAVAELNSAGVPAGVLVAPIIVGLNDHEIPAILHRAGQAGARFAGYTLLRLSHGLKQLFEDWLERHYPASKQKILGRIRDTRGGNLNDPEFGSRMRGEGPLAELVAKIFRVARERAGIPTKSAPLSTAAFCRPDSTPRLF